ncbi:MAG: rhomboid family intramembrane serine protease [Pirellulales bacterium]|jgi:rhomboid family GlyGly-CTERM serine protease
MYQLMKEIPITLTVAVATVVVFLIPGLESLLDFQTNLPVFHQLIQLFGCHMAHWSFDHLVWDLVMFVTMGVICERRNSIQYAIALALSAITIPLLVSYFALDVSSYRGLSGLDTALFGLAVLYLVDSSIREKNWPGVGMYAFLFAGMMGKIAYECFVGGTLFVNSEGFTAVPIAHLVGAVIGTAIGLFEIARRPPAQLMWRRVFYQTRVAA